MTRFFEIHPANVGTPPTGTEVLFLYDAEQVFIGVRAADPSPEAIRAPLTKRDHAGSDQDYVEILIDTAGARQSALVFRTNARGIASDAQFNEQTQAHDFAPDLDFEVRTRTDTAGWSAEFRIPFATLRYSAGSRQSWVFLVQRGYPRGDSVRISSAPIPHGAVCQLCFAGVVDGVSAPAARIPLSATPQAAYARVETHAGPIATRDQQLRAGLDVRWQPRPDTVADFTLRPDFSQVEADSPQLTADERFAIFLEEKRPFFLESVDVFSTPLPVLYTRTLTDPDLGVRYTRRGDSSDFAAIVVRDAGGGSVLQPGPTTSQIGAQDFESTALLARHRLSRGGVSFGTLGSIRINDDGSDNVIVGADIVWSPSPSDRLVAQALWSNTEDPNRPDLLPDWTGRNLAGDAAVLRWEHGSDSWFADVSHERSTRDFRAWNGFVPQTGISRVSASSGWHFYPAASRRVRLSPSVQASRTDRLGGEQIDGETTLSLQVEAPRNAVLILTGRRDRELTQTGLQSFDVASLSFSVTPASWIPALAIGATGGEGLHVATGDVGEQLGLSSSLRLRFLDRLEVHANVARQHLEGRRAGDAPRRLLLDDSVVQVSATWHFSSRLYAHVLYQDTRVIHHAVDGADDMRFRSEFASLLFSLQTRWQTRFFVGLSRGIDRPGAADEGPNTTIEAFAKATYSFSIDRGR